MQSTIDSLIYGAATVSKMSGMWIALATINIPLTAALLPILPIFLWYSHTKGACSTLQVAVLVGPQLPPTGSL